MSLEWANRAHIYMSSFLLYLEAHTLLGCLVHQHVSHTEPLGYCLIIILFIHPIENFWIWLLNFILINCSLYFHPCPVFLSSYLCWRSPNHIQLQWFTRRACRTRDIMVLTAKIYYNAKSAKGKGTWWKVHMKPGSICLFAWWPRHSSRSDS